MYVHLYWPTYVYAYAYAYACAYVRPASITETEQHRHATAENTETCMTGAIRGGGAANLPHFPASTTLIACPSTCHDTCGSSYEYVFWGSITILLFAPRSPTTSETVACGL
jgi:hypothetical protein